LTQNDFLDRNQGWQSYFQWNNGISFEENMNGSLRNPKTTDSAGGMGDRQREGAVREGRLLGVKTLEMREKSLADLRDKSGREGIFVRLRGIFRMTENSAGKKTKK
jgi:hypothetical protein